MASQVKYHVPGEHVYKGMVMPAGFPAAVLDQIPQFEFHEGDILIATYPKAGTTWMQEIIDQVIHGGNEARRKIPIFQRVPFLEAIKPEMKSIELLENMDGPRAIKTHLPAGFFKNQLASESHMKIIIVMRNIKDNLVSYYHFYRMDASLGLFSGTWSEFFDDLVKHDYIVGGTWFDFNKSWLAHRNMENIHFFFYEDMIANPCKTVSQVANILEKKLTDEQLNKIVELTSFNSMKQMESDFTFVRHDISNFFRKGMVGDWKNHFTKEQERYIDELYKERMVGVDIDFQYEL